MKENKELEKIKKEIFEKIGGNVMLFQQVEHMLKFILEVNDISGYVNEIELKDEARKKAIQKKTMGQLVGNFMDSSFSKIGEEVENSEPVEVKGAWISIQHRVECDKNYYENINTNLEKMVKERNDLIHHLLPRWDARSYQSSLKIKKYLDELRLETRSQFENLKSHIQVMQTGRELLASFITSDEGDKYFFTIPYLLASKLVSQLIDIANSPSRPDRWVELSKAVNIINHKTPDEIRTLKAKYGYKNLKKLMLATEHFDIAEENTKKGGVRVIYRLRNNIV